MKYRLKTKEMNWQFTQPKWVSFHVIYCFELDTMYQRFCGILNLMRSIMNYKYFAWFIYWSILQDLIRCIDPYDLPEWYYFAIYKYWDFASPHSYLHVNYPFGFGSIRFRTMRHYNTCIIHAPYLSNFH